MRAQVLSILIATFAASSPAMPPMRDQPAYEAAALLRTQDYCWRIGFAIAAAEYQHRIGIPEDLARAAPLYALMASSDDEANALRSTVRLAYERKHWTSEPALQRCNVQGSRQLVDNGASNLGSGQLGDALRNQRELILRQLAPVLIPAER